MSKQIQYLIAGQVIVIVILVTYIATSAINKSSSLPDTASSKHNQTEQQASKPLAEDSASQLASESDQAVSQTDIDQAIQMQNEAVAETEAMVKAQNAANDHLGTEIDSEFHPEKTLNTKPSHYGLRSIKLAPVALKQKVNEIDQMLIPHLMEVWGRSRSDQIAKEVEGWQEEGDILTYRTAWGSDRYQCTWYVLQWNKYTQQLIDEGYMPCF